MSTLEERRAVRRVVTEGQIADVFFRGFKYGFFASSAMTVVAFVLGMLVGSP